MKASPQKISPDLKAALFTDLNIVLTDIRKMDKMADFLVRFLSQSELLVLSKRMGILKRLYSNYSYEEIQNELKVSSATISSMAEIKDELAVDEAIEKIAVHDWAEKIAFKIKKFLP